jgi:hypothetical protein
MYYQSLNSIIVKLLSNTPSFFFLSFGYLLEKET